MGWYYDFKPYVSVAQRRAKAAAFAGKLAKKEKRRLAPITIEGRMIARTFWGQAWCENLERYSDFASRLPRGRTYVRNGSVIDLQIERGKIRAIVSGSEIYRVTIDIRTLSKSLWKKVKQECGQSITSLIDLMQGRFDKGIMERLSRREGGLFPLPAEIEMDCTCPDWAGMCKHVAAVLYGVGARLDSAPELLFQLRNVDHLELIQQATSADSLENSLVASGSQTLSSGDLETMFGIELDMANASAKALPADPSRQTRKTRQRPPKTKIANGPPSVRPSAARASKGLSGPSGRRRHGREAKAVAN